MAGIQGRDFQVGDRPQWSIDDARRRQEAYQSGARIPNGDDIRMAQMKIRDGLYPWWEENEAKAIMAAARARGMIKPPAPVVLKPTPAPVEPVRVIQATYYGSSHSYDSGPSGREMLAILVVSVIVSLLFTGWLYWYLEVANIPQ